MRSTRVIELSANVWPVIDAGTGLVLRYFMRAYAMDASDSVIGTTLRALAPTDFLLAEVFRIPQRHVVVSQYGDLNGCVSISDFHEQRALILPPAFEELEKSYARLQGVSVAHRSGEVLGISQTPKFPADPYLLVTSLLETADGKLIPQTDD